MKQTLPRLAYACAALALSVGMSFAQSTITSAPGADYLLDSYLAYIGPADVRNSRGVRLTEPWQIIRQDRANVHRFGIADAADTYDNFFGDAANREQMETMLRNGWIDGQAARDIMRGGALILVEIYGQGSIGTSVHVSVAN